MTIPPFLIPVIAGLFAQVLKPFVNREWRKEKSEHPDPRPRYGGMPSAHTAFATSLAIVASLSDGIRSASFAVAIAILILILDDALRLRIFLERFGIAIRRVSSLLSPDEQRKLPPIEERIGHTVPEVLLGAFIGIIVTVFLWTLG